MSAGFNRLTQAQIRKSQTEGKLSGLAGEGAPLPDRSGEAELEVGVQVAHRLVAEAGVLPREFSEKARLEAARARYAEAQTETGRHAAMAEIAEAEMAYAMAVEARRRFLR